MKSIKFTDKLHGYSSWRDHLVSTMIMYRDWRKRYGLETPVTADIINHVIENLSHDRVTLAFVAEFSRGKTELINSLFFSETGTRLLPSSPGRTTMCPTEIFYDQDGGSYISLLDIESRYADISFSELKVNPAHWKKVQLDLDNPGQMQACFKELIATKTVSKAKALELGLFNENEAKEQGLINPDFVDIPTWRHAMISFPHPLLKAGLCILDTPGLNALGTEPELTLSMLPSTQAIIFVLGADTGVTKSDMSIWKQHVCGASNTNKQGLAVVLNKIDLMWDDLLGEIGYESAIRSQVKSTASILGIPENLIFPISAKQSLLGKLKGDNTLVKASRIGLLESYLSDNILEQRQKILVEAINRDIGVMIKESYTLTDINCTNQRAQLEEFKKLDFENQDTVEKLSTDTHLQQVAYLKNIDHFKTSKRAFHVKFSQLIDSLSLIHFDSIIIINKSRINANYTTFGLKKDIKNLFNDLRNHLNDSVELANDAKQFIIEMHRRFDTSYGLKQLTPTVFEISDYQAQLEELFIIGEEFRTSTKMIMTEKSLVSDKIFSILINQARKIMYKAHNDALKWGENVLSPITGQLVDHKKQIENRLNVLRVSGESKNDLNNNILSLVNELSKLTQQQQELNEIIKNIQKASDF